MVEKAPELVVMALYSIDGEVRWLLREPGLIAYLAERGIADLPADIPAVGR